MSAKAVPHFGRLIKSNYHHVIQTLRNHSKNSSSSGSEKEWDTGEGNKERGYSERKRNLQILYYQTKETNSLRSMKASHISKLSERNIRIDAACLFLYYYCYATNACTTQIVSQSVN